MLQFSGHQQRRQRLRAVIHGFLHIMLRWWWCCSWTLAFLCLVGAACGYRALSNDELDYIARRLPETHGVMELVQPLLIPRVSGTMENQLVRQNITSFFAKLGWTVELDTFTDETPLGPIEFSNIIATKNPDAPKRLVLAAHYDSKYFKDGEFIGATDSAVPCGILIHIAEVLNDYLTTTADTTLQMVFFDGEEAFVTWSAEDSIYGARHLAQKWSESGELSKIQVLALLDLLGTPDIKIPNYYKATSDLFYKLRTLERRLALKPRYLDLNSVMTYRGEWMQDDHVPFLQRGVKILHIIPYPFPKVWHDLSVRN